MIVKLPTEHHLEFLSLKGGCRGSSESTLVKMSNCWKSHAAAQMGLILALEMQDKTINQDLMLLCCRCKVRRCTNFPYKNVIRMIDASNCCCVKR